MITIDPQGGPLKARAPAGSPEGKFVARLGKAPSRHISDVKHQGLVAKSQLRESQDAEAASAAEAEERQRQHRGGDRPWPLRSLIVPAMVAEAATAYVAVEVLVSSQELAFGLSIVTAGVGAGMACYLANRRLSMLPVPAIARALEVAFVAVMTVLRLDSLHLQGADLEGALGGAALAALVSAVGLIAIEELVVETHTFRVFVANLRAWADRRRSAAAARRVARLESSLEAAGEQVRQHFFEFLLKEGFDADEAQRRAVALRRALVDGEEA